MKKIQYWTKLGNMANTNEDKEKCPWVFIKNLNKIKNYLWEK